MTLTCFRKGAVISCPVAGSWERATNCVIDQATDNVERECYQIHPGAMPVSVAAPGRLPLFDNGCPSTGLDTRNGTDVFNSAGRHHHLMPRTSSIAPVPVAAHGSAFAPSFLLLETLPLAARVSLDMVRVCVCPLVCRRLNSEADTRASKRESGSMWRACDIFSSPFRPIALVSLRLLPWLILLVVFTDQA